MKYEFRTGLSGCMSKTRTKKAAGENDSKNVYTSRVQFTEALAALSSLFRDEVSRRGEKKSLRIYDQLGLEWLLNNLPLRALQSPDVLCLLPAGTTSNEALRAEMRGSMRQTQDDAPTKVSRMADSQATAAPQHRLLQPHRSADDSGASPCATARPKPVDAELLARVDKVAVRQSRPAFEA